MKISDFCRMCGSDILFQSIHDKEYECDFSLGIHHVYPGCSVSLPITEGFCNIFACSQENWEWFLSSAENLYLPQTALFIVYSAHLPISIPESCRDTNVLFLAFSSDTLFGRIANLTVQRHLTPEAESLYAAFWERVTSTRTADYTNISEFLKKMPNPVHPYMSIIVVKHFTDTNNSLSIADRTSGSIAMQELNALRSFFPGQNIFYLPATEEHIILYSQQEPDSYSFYYPLHNFSYLNFSELLKKYHLHAGLSNAGRAIEHMYTLYLNAKNALKMGEALKQPSHFPGIYHQMEYTPYHVIDLCFPEFIHQFGHDNLIYLIHPSIISLYRYDSANNTELLDTLYTYLACGHSISETASSLFIHRNTVCNRIKKINEITSLSTDNPQVQSMLQLSCQIFLYYRDVIKKRLD